MGPLVTDGSTTISVITKVPIGARSASAQVCRLRFGGDHDHGWTVGIQRVRELAREFFAVVDIHRPASEPCCKGCDVKSRKVQAWNARCFLELRERLENRVLPVAHDDEYDRQP